MTAERDPQPSEAGSNGRPAHVPVLLSEMLACLAPKDGETFIDGTFGAGGYSRSILQAADCRVIGIDRDPAARERGAALAGEFPGRFTLVPGRFGEMDELARTARAFPTGAGDGVPWVDGAVLDIGVSSMQLDEAERGFSFMADGPLDMRMGVDGPSAADVVNETDDEELADILYQLGEEHRSRAVARAIAKVRAEKPFERTRELADVVARVLGRGKPGHHPATRTFQALRIFVNDELGELARGLAAAERILKPGGRLVVVTFHSLEDRIVKRFLAERAGKQAQGSRHRPEISIKSNAPSFRIVNRSPLTPSKGEQEANPRSRSARLRAAERTDAAAWPLDLEAIGVPAVSR